MQQTNTQMTIVYLDAQTINSKFDRIEQLISEGQKNVVIPTQDRILTREETAHMLKISLPTLWDWTNKKILTAYRIGNSVRYKEIEVINALIPINKRIANK